MWRGQKEGCQLWSKGETPGRPDSHTIDQSIICTLHKSLITRDGKSDGIDQHLFSV